MRLKHLPHRLFRLIKQDSGAIAVMFAIMSPLLLMFYSLAIDGANFQSSRARLADGLNQGVLAVAMVDNRNITSVHKTENMELLRQYLTYYLPNTTIPPSELDIAVVLNYSENNDLKSVDYSASGKARVHPMLGASAESQGRPGFSANVDINASSGAGVVRKTIEKIKYPTDYVFVVDFSGSMLESSAEAGLTRIELLQSVVTEFARTVLEDNEQTTVGIVPFGIGVPVALNKKNIMGGNELGCSFVGKLNSKYKDVDFDFWYNKSRQSSTTVTEKAQSYYHDYALETYYSTIISLASGLNQAGMVSRGWCVKNAANGSVSTGKATYSCDADERANLFKNYDEFKNTRSAALDLMSAAEKHWHVVNIDTLDFDATLADDYLFSDAAVTTYIHTYSSLSMRPFGFMCNSALETSPEWSTATLASNIKTIDEPKSYLIELTSDPAAIDDFAKMSVLKGVGTDSSGGLLRSVPVIAKGVNTRKVIIIVSDGDDSDSDGSSSESGPIVVTKKLHETYGICNKIKSGLLKYPEGTKTTQSDMYFISVVDDKSTNSRIKFWANNCVGSENAIVATNYKNLITSLMGIAQKGSVNYINKNDE